MVSDIFARSLSVGSALVVLLPCTAFVSSAQADIIHVPKDYPTIQGAINVASKGDEIIVAPGTYNEQINFLGQDIYLHSSDGADATTITSDGDIVTCASGEGPDAILDGFSITGGTNGIHNFNGSAPTVRNCLLTQNLRGIYNVEASIVVSNTAFLDNGQTAGFAGGLVSHLGALTMSDCVLIGNRGDNGAGVYSVFGNLHVVRCYFADNIARLGGGAIRATDWDTPSVIRHSIFIANESAGSGGAIYSGQGEMSVSNCLFIENSAENFGGAIWSNPGITISLCTFMGNEAANGGAVFVSDATIDNSVFWLNFPNQIAGTAEVNCSDIHGGWDGPGKGNINAFPEFVDMEGGNLRLLNGSPCIDTGSNDFVPEDLIVDLDGNERIVDGDGDGEAVVDMGAYEYQGYPVCDEDLDGDGAVGPFDLALVLGNWGFNPGSPADLDHDGTVGPFDLALLLGAWGPCQ